MLKPRSTKPTRTKRSGSRCLFSTLPAWASSPATDPSKNTPTTFGTCKLLLDRARSPSSWTRWAVLAWCLTWVLLRLFSLALRSAMKSLWSVSVPCTLKLCARSHLLSRLTTIKREIRVNVRVLMWILVTISKNFPYLNKTSVILQFFRGAKSGCEINDRKVMSSCISVHHLRDITRVFRWFTWNRQNV